VNAAPSIRGGFSLLEMLVAVTVLSILVAILSQIILVTGKAIGVNARRLDGAGQARVFFGRLEADLASRPRRSDLRMAFAKSPGNDSLRFYSGVPGYGGTRNVTLVGYRVQEAAQGRLYQLERGASGSGWTSADLQPAFLSALSGPAESDYEVLSPGIFRLEVSFLPRSSVSSSSSSSSSSVAPSVSAASDYSDVGALLVAVAVLDAKSRLLLTDAQVAALSRLLPDSAAGAEPLATWSAVVAGPDFAPGLPRLAIQGVRLYQRTFDVP